jgi:hypothetical protein
MAETGKYFFHNIAVFQTAADVSLSLLFEGRHIILKSMSEGGRNKFKTGYLVSKPINRFG